MAAKPLPSPETLRQLLRYEPETGKLFWRRRPVTSTGDKIFNRLYADREAFTYRMGHKHKQGRVNGKALLAHRVVWAIVYGEWPTHQIDHINGNPIDNRIGNLRDIPSGENQKNMKRFSTNKSGVSGIDWQKGRSAWRVRIKNDGKDVYIGNYIPS